MCIKHTRIEIKNSQALEEAPRKFRKETNSAILAPKMHCTQNTWLDRLNPDREAKLGLLEAANATAETGNLSLLEGFADYLGYGIYKKCEAQEMCMQELMMSVLKTQASSGDICKIYQQAIEDNEICEEEADVLISAVDIAIKNLKEFRSGIKSHKGRG